MLGEADGVTVYDDFAHHPTAIATTLAGLRARVGGARIVVAMDRAAIRCDWARTAMRWRRRSTMPTSWCSCIARSLAWDAGKVVGGLRGEGVTAPDAVALIAALAERVRPDDHVVFMSNGGFDGAPRRFLATRHAR